MTLRVEDLTEFLKESLWFFGTLQHLESLEFLEGSTVAYSITPQGIALFDQLVATGFKPSLEAIKGMLRATIEEAEEFNDLLDLLTLYRDSPDCVEDIAQEEKLGPYRD